MDSIQIHSEASLKAYLPTLWITRRSDRIYEVTAMLIWWPAFHCRNSSGATSCTNPSILFLSPCYDFEQACILARTFWKVTMKLLVNWDSMPFMMADRWIVHAYMSIHVSIHPFKWLITQSSQKNHMRTPGNTATLHCMTKAADDKITGDSVLIDGMSQSVSIFMSHDTE